MAMKETEGSLRAYFLVAGVIAALSSISDLGDARKVAGIDLPLKWMLALWFPIIARLLLGAGFIAAGVKLKAALPTGARWIQQMLLGSIAVLVIDAVLIGSVLGSDLGRTGLIQSVIGLLIAAYLLASVRRLSAEAMAKTAPPARVV